MKNWAQRHCSSLVGLVSLFGLMSSVSADEIFFTSGESRKGLVVEEHADRLVVSTVDGEQTVRRRDIDEVFFDDPERNYLYLGNEALAEGDAAGALALYRKAMSFNPRWEEARHAVQRAEDLRRKQATGWMADDPARLVQSAWGLRVAAEVPYPVLTVTAPRQAAALAGIETGDMLVALWGGSTGYRPLREVLDELAGPPATTITVTVQRTITLRPQDVPRVAWPGFELAMAPAGLTVSQIRARGAAAGLRAGDLIIAVNGRPTRYLPLAAARAMVAQPRAGGLTLQIQRPLVITRTGGDS